jgi:hypothetical protein
MVIMGTHRTTQCKNGHPWTDANTRTSTDRYGITRRICSICRNAYVNAALTLRYRTDPAWRELQKAKSRVRYHNVRKHKPTCEAP